MRWKISNWPATSLTSPEKQEKNSPIRARWQVSASMQRLKTISMATPLSQMRSTKCVLITLIVTQGERKPSSSDTFTSRTFGDFSGTEIACHVSPTLRQRARSHVCKKKPNSNLLVAVSPSELLAPSCQSMQFFCATNSLCWSIHVSLITGAHRSIDSRDIHGCLQRLKTPASAGKIRLWARRESTSTFT